MNLHDKRDLIFNRFKHIEIIKVFLISPTDTLYIASVGEIKKTLRIPRCTGQL